MTLEEQFRNGLAGQLSSEKTEVDIRVASKIAREFAIKFVEWRTKKGNYHIGNWNKTNEEMLKIYENEVLGK